jgi:hypothetical protein
MAHQEMLQKAEQQVALNSLLKAFAVEQAKQTELLRDLIREGPEVIAEKLKDMQPLVRWLATQAAGRKRLHFEEQLINLLADPYPQVRQGAREALIRLSRGNDFGPAPNATAKQQTQAIDAWRLWLRRQDPPEATTDSLINTRR